MKEKPDGKSKIVAVYNGKNYTAKMISDELGLSRRGVQDRLNKYKKGKKSIEWVFRAVDQRYKKRLIAEPGNSSKTQAKTDGFMRQTRNQDRLIEKYYAPCALDKR